MLNASLSLLAFTIVVVGGCWWMDRRGTGSTSSLRSTDSGDQSAMAAAATVIALSDASSCSPSMDHSGHGACTDY